MVRFSTAGESHGEALVALVSGLPAGVPVDQDFMGRELWRRQQGYGRGGRMRIERDSAHILSGVRHGRTIGAPIAMTLANNDWKNWEEILPVGAGDAEKHKAVKSPRPGHADLPGALKYGFADARYVLERASARESAARVACGALAKMLLAEFGVEVRSHTVRVGSVELGREATWEEIVASCEREEVLLNCVDAEREQAMKAEVDRALRTGDTVGGVFEVVVHGLVPGVGTHVNWDERMDGLLAQAVMSLQAVKAVELGRGVTAASSMGSAVHDAIHYEENVVHGAGPGEDEREPEDGGCEVRSGLWTVYRLCARVEQCRGARGRDFEWRRCGGAGVSEADFHPAATAGERRLCHAGAGEGGLRTQRCMCGSGGGCGSRGDGGVVRCEADGGEVRRGFAGRNAAEFRWVSGADS